MTTRTDRLTVYFGDECVGTLYDTSPIAFEYAPTWLSRRESMRMADMALVAGRNTTDAVPAYFENLLPEGELRVYLSEQHKASTLFRMLLTIAGDTAGAFVILRGDEKPVPPSYEQTSWEALAALLGKTSAAAIDLHGGNARISLAGAQDKTSLAIFEDGIPWLPRGTAPSTHILKPDIKRLDKVWHSAANEAIVMLTAANCGLPTADVFYEPRTRSCVVRRFDRTTSSDGSLGRLVQYDLCQLAGTLSDRKYEKEGGPGIAACAEIVRRYSTQPAVDLRNLVVWIFFNLYTGNNDSHAKNLSVYWRPGGVVALTPFYDLMSTRVYPGLSKDFALSIGGEFLPGAVTHEHVAAMARQLRMQPRFVLKLASDLAAKMPEALAQAVAAVKPVLPDGAKDLAAQLSGFVLSTTRKTAARLAGSSG